VALVDLQDREKLTEGSLIMNLATGAIGALIPKLGSLLKDEFGLQKGVKGGIKRLMTELESMQAYLEKMSAVPVDQLDKNARLWAREVRELSYDIEDRIDTFLVRVEGKKTETVHVGIKGFIAWTSNLLSKVMIHHKLAKDIKDIMARVKDAKERHDRYTVDKSVASSTIKSDPRLQALYRKVTQLVGIDEKRVELINMLNKGDDAVSKKKLKSISVVGVGGLGKTTLAKALYDKIKVEFECCAFVSVGQNPEVKKVLKDILLELDKQRFKDIHNLIRDEKQLIDLILEFLDNKRYAS
jgi:disease resistance protein RPM1